VKDKGTIGADWESDSTGHPVNALF